MAFEAGLNGRVKYCRYLKQHKQKAHDRINVYGVLDCWCLPVMKQDVEIGY